MGFKEVRLFPSKVIWYQSKFVAGPQCEIHGLSGWRGDCFPSKGASHASKTFHQGYQLQLHQPWLEWFLLICCQNFIEWDLRLCTPLKAGVFLPKSRPRLIYVVHSYGCSPILSLRLQDILIQSCTWNKVDNKGMKYFRVSIWGVNKSLFSVMGCTYTVTHILMTKLVREQLQTIETCSESSPYNSSKSRSVRYWRVGPAVGGW